jgi:hypothetical protein
MKQLKQLTKEMDLKIFILTKKTNGSYSLLL